jgi:hypothetical protein
MLDMETPSSSRVGVRRVLDTLGTPGTLRAAEAERDYARLWRDNFARQAADLKHTVKVCTDCLALSLLVNILGAVAWFWWR